MATTINSGYANSPKLTANIADHADVYGGRALVFDGVVDYLDCGTGLGNQLGNNYSGGLSVSMWINVNSNTSITEKGLFFIGNFGGSYGEFTITQNTNNLMIYLNQNAYQKTFAYTARDTWTHICFVVDSQSESNTKFYIDGEAQSILTNVNNTFPSSGDLDFSGLKTVIGNFFNGNYPFHGKITDTKVFNSALTEAQVQELYKKPESTPSQDNLVAWYPMIEGNPESPQSTVFDHSEKKLGSDIITNGDYSNGTTGWSIGAGGTADTSSGALVYTYSGSGNNFVKQEGITAVNGALYKAVFTVTESGGSAYYGYWDGTNLSSSVINLDTGQKTYTQYFTATSTSITIRFVAGSSNGNSITVDNVSVKEVLMGNHATTNFFGDELITNGDFASDANWTKGDGWSIGNGVATSDDSAQSATSYLKSASFTALSTSKTYRLSYTIVRNAGTVDFIGVGGGDTGLTHRTASGTYSEDFVPSGANTQIWVVSGDGGFDGTVDNISLKEIGVSSSGFETAVNEPVVPQVPLMRYNQKMFFDGSDGYVQLPAPLSSTNHTISAWYVANSGDNYILDARDSGSDGISLGLLANGTIWYAVRGSGNNSVSSSSGSFNVLNHVVATYNGSTAKIYLNGVEVGSGTFTDTVSTTTNARIGRISYGSTGHFDGVVHEVAFYNKDFTQAEAQELFNDGVALDATTHSQSANLIGYWRNDGVTTWKDRSTNSNDGSVQGSPDSITIREGLNSNRDGLGFYFTNPSNNVLRLNGVDEYVVAPDTDLSLSEQITIECWAKNNSDDLATDEYFASHYETTSGNYRSWFFRMKPNEALRFVWSSNGTDYSAVETSSSVSNVNTWRHYVVTLASGVPKIYVDGESLTLDSIYNSNGLQTSIYNTIGNIFIGRIAANDNDYHWNGLIDEVKIYNRALSLAEIQKNYKHQKGKHTND